MGTTPLFGTEKKIQQYTKKVKFRTQKRTINGVRDVSIPPPDEQSEHSGEYPN